MAGRGVLSKGGFFSVWKIFLLPVTVHFALTVGANADQQSLLPVSGGYNDAIHGAFVMFARNHDLNSVLYTMNQLQGADDKPLSKNGFPKDWVFYSDEKISDEFKILTSNLTLPGAAFYECWSRRDLASKGWNLPVLSQHKRLRGYNWAWSITPGTEFHSKINFDAFEAMKSEGMIYGSSTSGLLQATRPGSANTEDSDTAARGFPRGIREVQWSIGKGPGAGGRDGSMTVVDDPARFGTVSTERSPAWLALVYEMCNFCWDFEIVWLDLFRNIDYLKIANYIINNLKTDPVVGEASSVSTSSPTSFDFKSQPKPTSCNAPVGLIDKVASSARPRTGVFYLLGNPDEDISRVHERWMQMADDFDEQGRSPGLRAGRTSLFWRSKVYTHRGKRARAWLFRQGEEIPSALILREKGDKHPHEDDDLALNGDDD